jgi:hypothetical protein
VTAHRDGLRGQDQSREQEHKSQRQHGLSHSTPPRVHRQDTGSPGAGQTRLSYSRICDTQAHADRCAGATRARLGATARRTPPVNLIIAHLQGFVITSSRHIEPRTRVAGEFAPRVLQFPICCEPGGSGDPWNHQRILR